MVAMDLWDDEAWFALAAGQVQLARANGTLSWLPFALDYLAENHIQAGQLSTAAALLAEGERIDPGIRAATLPYVLRFAGGSAVSDPTRINRRGMAVMDYNSRSWWCPSLTWTSYGSFASFSDPDGNGWLLQEITTRLPGR